MSIISRASHGRTCSYVIASGFCSGQKQASKALYKVRELLSARSSLAELRAYAGMGPTKGIFSLNQAGVAIGELKETSLLYIPRKKKNVRGLPQRTLISGSIKPNETIGP